MRLFPALSTHSFPTLFHAQPSLLKSKLEHLLTQALTELGLSFDKPPQLVVPPKPEQGDWSTNLAMTLAKSAGLAPRQLAEKLVATLPKDDDIDRVEIAGPGFINFFISQSARDALIAQILREGERWGHRDLPKAKKTALGRPAKAQIEFVSANPTGPLHIGHGRGAALGAALTRILQAAGWTVEREYYLNDAGRQIDILALSVWLRCQRQGEADRPLPTGCYQGSYIARISQKWLDLHAEDRKDQISLSATDEESADPDDTDSALDRAICCAREQLGTERFEEIGAFARDCILEDIRSDLHEFGIDFEVWFHESSLVDQGLLEIAIERLRNRGHVYDQDGAVWFASSTFGDDKDRVLVRSNGRTTYFASDVAYLWNKIQRGFTRIIYLWGADHHGYVARLRSCLQALGAEDTAIEIVLIQLVALARGGKRIQMSSRTGDFVTLRELRTEVGNDAAHFFYLMKRPEQHLEFDLELARSESNENPVYYVQYAHARLAGIARTAVERGMSEDKFAADTPICSVLSREEYRELMDLLGQFPQIVRRSAENLAPHLLTHFLRGLAGAFHSWYNGYTVLVDDTETRRARLMLCAAVRQTLVNGLSLLGLTAPQTM